MKKIEFFSLYPGLVETYPVIPASELSHKWVKVAKDINSRHGKRRVNILRCPGIMDVMSAGYIVQAPHDFDIIVKGMEVEFEYPPKMNNHELKVQAGTGQAGLLPSRPWRNETILKVDTPWNVIAPYGVKFLCIPLPYAEQSDIESVIGILDPAIDTELNCQMYINFKEGKRTITAGTPLMQLIPLTEKDYDYVVRDANERDRHWMHVKIAASVGTFIFNRNKLKQIYKKFFGTKCPFHRSK